MDVLIWGNVLLSTWALSNQTSGQNSSAVSLPVGAPPPPKSTPRGSWPSVLACGDLLGGDGHLRQENPEFGTPGYSAVGHVTAPGFSVWFGSQEVSVNRVPTQKVGL